MTGTPIRGNLSAREMVHRIWSVLFFGGYCTHGETFHRDDQVLWWSKGGVLHGESEPRIAFVKSLFEGLPPARPMGYVQAGNPNEKEEKDDAYAQQQQRRFGELISRMSEHQRLSLAAGRPLYLEGDGFRIHYLGRTCPCFVHEVLPEGVCADIEVIDTFDMTRETVLTDVSGVARVPLPAHEGMAVLMRW